MKSIIVSLAAAAGLVVASSAMAAEPPATTAVCGACHNRTTDVRKVGPGWVAVAKKYAGDAKAVETISAHIKSGGQFGWKFGTMPPKGTNMGLTDAQIKEIAEFIVSLK